MVLKIAYKNKIAGSLLRDLERAIRRKTGIGAKLKIKKMDEALPLPNKWADEKEIELFYKDYVIRL